MKKDIEFLYKAIIPSGKIVTGNIIASSRNHAMTLLFGQGVHPIEIQEQTNDTHPAALLFQSNKKLPVKKILPIIESISALIKAGITLDRALFISANVTKDEQSKAFITAVLQQVRSGSSLTDAINGQNIDLPKYASSIIETGEMSGNLFDAFERLLNLLKKDIELRDKILSTLTYPMILLGMMIFTIMILVSYVLPKFETLFLESEVELPFSTQAVLILGNFMKDWWWAIIALMIAGYGVFLSWKKTGRGRYSYEKWMMNNKLLMDIPMLITSARLFRSVGTLIQSGITVPKAIKIVIKSESNLFINEILNETWLDVQSGKSFAKSLEAKKCYPDLAIQMIHVGEETGSLDNILVSVAITLEELAYKKIDRLLTIATPAITIIMGFIIALLIGSILVGLLSLNDLAI